MSVTVLAVGPAEHGVTGEALVQAAALLGIAPGPVHLVRRPALPAVGELRAALRTAPPAPLLVHVTDKLFGATPEEAADVVGALAAEHPLVLVLHDLPQASDGPRNAPRRAAAYRRMARAAAAVVVASRHEQRLLAACGVDARSDVVPLPVPDLRSARAVDEAAPLRGVAVLGYLYPGKGHEAVVAALDVLPAGVGLTAWGRPSTGHEDLADALAAQAAALGRPCVVTGYVPDADLPALLRSPVVPVAPHEHLSASGSINSWIGAGRRPLVPRSDYVAELEERSPGCVRIYDDLRTALVQAWEDPASTWLPRGAPGGPTAETAATLLLPVLARAAREVR
ncbi:glycosyltransferase [Blastococcus sp. TBT05-19]|uniref:glycosyltransferase n=1 Tax=Blastococcus sp. TBT05-19 TaxID=2250581 RepID=UPI00131437BF|nr:glycosyltransferase [Blastococcus sp. TBT05-19]